MTPEIFVPQHVSICAPAVRMLALFAVCNDDGTVEHEELPVVALRTTLGSLYASDAPEAPPLGASAAEMRENGWRFVSTEAREEPLVLARTAFVITVRDYSIAERAGVKRVIAAPWPWDEDELRLKNILLALDELAREEEARYQEACDADAPYQDRYARFFGASEQRHLTSTGHVPQARAFRDARERLTQLASGA